MRSLSAHVTLSLHFPIWDAEDLHDPQLTSTTRCAKLARVVEIREGASVSPEQPVRLGQVFEAGGVDYRWMPSEGGAVVPAAGSPAAAGAVSDGISAAISHASSNASNGGSGIAEKKRKKQMLNPDDE